MAHNSDFTLYRRLLQQARPYWPFIVAAFLLSLLSTPLSLLAPLPLKIVVDSVIGSRPLPAWLNVWLPQTQSPMALLAIAAGLVVAIAVLVYVHSLATWLLKSYTGEKLLLDFRAQLFRHVQRLSLAYHDAKGTSDSTYRIQYDAMSIQNIAMNGLIPFVASACSLVGMVVVMWRIDWQLALIALAISPVLFLLARHSRRRLRRHWSEVKQLESLALSVVQEVLAAVRVVKAFVREDHEHRRFLRHSHDTLRGHMRVASIEVGFDFLIGLTTALGTAATLFVGVMHVRSGSITLGQLLMVMAYLTQLYEPLRTMSKRMTDIQSGLVSAERAFALLDERSDVTERADARPVARASGAVAFRNVSFAYNEDRPVLQRISFEVPPGTRVGIKGPTGAGKTTLVSLITRFYDPTEGQVLLDGIDLREYQLADLRRQFAIVLQEPLLFSTSIAENIAYARPDATREEIIQAARLANIHDVIASLPDGYDTRVGERGMRLSGGERQRVSLARAFLKDAPMLILDEPTSSVDIATEEAIVAAMERLMRGRTTFIIAHRLSTLNNCNVLLKIDHGRLVEVTTMNPPGLSTASLLTGVS